MAPELGDAGTEPVRLLAERRYDPPRAVLVELDSQWWPGFQQAWRLTSDRGSWVAEVEFTAQYDWGRGKHLMAVPAKRVRLPEADQSEQPPEQPPGW